MKKTERVRAALRGETLDRPPFSFWTHLPGIDLDWQRIAEETAAFQARFDLDFVKSMPNGFYCVEDWGADVDFSGIAAGGVGQVTSSPIAAPDDWHRIGRIDVLDGAHGRELRHLERLRALVGPDVPILATVFSPITIAAKLSRDLHRTHLRESPQAVLDAIARIAEVTSDFARAAVARGCAGIFFALQDAAHAAFTPEEYARWGEPGDRAVLAAASAAGGWFNVLHMHGEGVHFDSLARYDVSALNWHIGETPPAIADYRASGGTRPILGGLQRAHITRCDREAVAADLRRSMAQTAQRGILISPACVIRYPIDDAMLAWVADTVRGYRAA